MNAWQASFADTPSPELEAFAYHLIFSEKHRQLVGNDDKFEYSVLFRYSPEDVVATVLSDDEAEGLRQWFGSEENRARLREILKNTGLRWMKIPTPGPG